MLVYTDVHLYKRGEGMPVVAIVNQKGGTGKTTLSINLASAFAELYPTLLMDADPQGSALDWADSRSTTRLMNLDALGVEPAHLLRDIRRLAPNYGWVIIDGPPGIGRISADAVRAADIVLIPRQAQPLRRVGGCGHRGGCQGSTGCNRRNAKGVFRHHDVPAPHPTGRPG